MLKWCCCVLGCPYDYMSGRTGYEFPLDTEWRQKWIEAVRKQIIGNAVMNSYWWPSPMARICSAHFERKDFLHSNDNDVGLLVRLLKADAVPSVFTSYLPRNGLIHTNMSRPTTTPKVQPSSHGSKTPTDSTTRVAQDQLFTNPKQLYQRMTMEINGVRKELMVPVSTTASVQVTPTITSACQNASVPDLLTHAQQEKQTDQAKLRTSVAPLSKQSYVSTTACQNVSVRDLLTFARQQKTDQATVSSSVPSSATSSRQSHVSTRPLASLPANQPAHLLTSEPANVPMISTQASIRINSTQASSLLNKTITRTYSAAKVGFLSTTNLTTVPVTQPNNMNNVITPTSTSQLYLFGNRLTLVHPKGAANASIPPSTTGTRMINSVVPPGTYHFPNRGLARDHKYALLSPKPTPEYKATYISSSTQFVGPTPSISKPAGLSTVTQNILTGSKTENTKIPATQPQLFHPTISLSTYAPTVGPTPSISKPASLSTVTQNILTGSKPDNTKISATQSQHFHPKISSSTYAPTVSTSCDSSPALDLRITSVYSLKKSHIKEDLKEQPVEVIEIKPDSDEDEVCEDQAGSSWLTSQQWLHETSPSSTLSANSSVTLSANESMLSISPPLNKSSNQAASRTKWGLLDDSMDGILSGEPVVDISSETDNISAQKDVAAQHQDKNVDGNEGRDNVHCAVSRNPEVVTDVNSSMVMPKLKKCVGLPNHGEINANANSSAEMPQLEKCGFIPAEEPQVVNAENLSAAKTPDVENTWSTRTSKWQKSASSKKVHVAACNMMIKPQRLLRSKAILDKKLRSISKRYAAGLKDCYVKINRLPSDVLDKTQYKQAQASHPKLVHDCEYSGSSGASCPINANNSDQRQINGASERLRQLLSEKPSIVKNLYMITKHANTLSSDTDNTVQAKQLQSEGFSPAESNDTTKVVVEKWMENTDGNVYKENPMIPEATVVNAVKKATVVTQIPPILQSKEFTMTSRTSKNVTQNKSNAHFVSYQVYKPISTSQTRELLTSQGQRLIVKPTGKRPVLTSAGMEAITNLIKTTKGQHQTAGNLTSDNGKTYHIDKPVHITLSQEPSMFTVVASGDKTQPEKGTCLWVTTNHGSFLIPVHSRGTQVSDEMSKADKAEAPKDSASDGSLPSIVPVFQANFTPLVHDDHSKSHSHKLLLEKKRKYPNEQNETENNEIKEKSQKSFDLNYTTNQKWKSHVNQTEVDTRTEIDNPLKKSLLDFPPSKEIFSPSTNMFSPPRNIFEQFTEPMDTTAQIPQSVHQPQKTFSNPLAPNADFKMFTEPTNMTANIPQRVHPPKNTSSDPLAPNTDFKMYTEPMNTTTNIPQRVQLPRNFIYPPALKADLEMFTEAKQTLKSAIDSVQANEGYEPIRKDKVTEFEKSKDTDKTTTTMSERIRTLRERLQKQQLETVKAKHTIKNAGCMLKTIDID